MIRAWGTDAIRRAEAPLLEAGVPLMRQAARALSVTAVREIRVRGQRVPGSVVLALVGGGNNGGDALWAAADLARRGVRAEVALCSPTVHAEGLEAARAAGARITRVVPDGGREPDLDALVALARAAGVWLDGLAGIGLRGPLREPLAGIVAVLGAERDAAPDEPVVIAVDVPSGMGDSGAVRGEVLRADVTVTMGGAKTGLLLPPAGLLAGRVDVVDLGLPLVPAEAAACRMGAGDVSDLYPFPRRQDHKYTRGVVGVWAGSPAYPGAARLACAGALAVGPGMVRYLGTVESVRADNPEVVATPGRIQAALVGSGIAGASAAHAAFEAAVAHGVPLVVDAGGLDVLDRAARAGRLELPCVITPHAGELAGLLHRGRGDVEDDPAAAAREYAISRSVVVLLKGAVTVVASPAGELFSQADSTPWLASAGSGDVLAGILAGLVALLAARAEEGAAGGEPLLGTSALARAAAAASWIHSQAGWRAAGQRGQAGHGGPPAGGPLAAHRIAAHVPRVIAGLPR